MEGDFSCSLGGNGLPAVVVLSCYTYTVYLLIATAPTLPYGYQKVNSGHGDCCWGDDEGETMVFLVLERLSSNCYYKEQERSIHCGVRMVKFGLAYETH